jgi:hypothetical protein
MLHDRELLDRLSAFSPVRFDGVTFRATRWSLDPLAGSFSGGRWVPRDVTQVLYTSLERDGAIAEIAHHLSLLTPKPSKPVKVHEIRVGAGSVVRLLRADLSALGVNAKDYGSLNYERTEKIGAAVAFLECDGLIAPSARWDCDNLTLFLENHALDEKLELVRSEEVDWREWVRQHAGG